MAVHANTAGQRATASRAESHASPANENRLHTIKAVLVATLG